MRCARVGSVVVIASLLTVLIPGAHLAQAQTIIGRWPSYSDGPPPSRGAPISFVTHQMDDLNPGWTWIRVEDSPHWHWQRDVKIEDDWLSEAIHGNSDNHRLQIGEPAVFRSGAGYRLEFYIKHNRKGPNPILKFDVYIEQGRVDKIYCEKIRGPGGFTNFAFTMAQKGLNSGVDAALSWATGGVATAFGQSWNLIKAITPEDWHHQYKGWDIDAQWFAIQIGDLYARALPWGDDGGGASLATERTILVVNNTGMWIDVYVSANAMSDRGRKEWTPTLGPFRFSPSDRRPTQLTASDGWVVGGDWICIWAEGPNGETWNEFKEQPLRITKDYSDAGPDIYTFTFR